MEKIKTEYCDYKTSMMLKKLGYDEPCESFFQEAVQHNGKDISFDEELDLKGEGRGKEIKRIKGGSIDYHYNRNSDDWLGKYCCSRPILSQVVRWLRERKKWHIESYPIDENTWRLWIIKLDSRDPHDGKLNACDFDGKTFCSYEKAIATGTGFLLKCMLDAEKKLLKMDKE